MEIEKFLEEFVEGYLFHDLREMDKIKIKKGERYGEACYPMLAATVAGVELLGCLVSTHGFVVEPSCPEQGEKQDYNPFGYYWKNYLSKVDPRYRPFGPIFRELVRNGIAHTFLTKPGIHVFKGVDSRYPHLATDGRSLTVNCSILARDFEQSYTRFVRPIVFDGHDDGRTTRAQMQDRLNEVLDAYSKKSADLFSNLSPRTYSPESVLESLAKLKWETEANVAGSLGPPYTGGTVTPFKLPDDGSD